MAIAEKLRQIAKENEGVMMQGNANRMSLIEMERRLKNELAPFVDQLVKDAINKISVRDGAPGLSGAPGRPGRDGSPESPQQNNNKI